MWEDIELLVWTDGQLVQKIYSWITVVFFDQLSGAARTWKLVVTLFFSRFHPFLFISNLFQLFHGWNQQKTTKKNKKRVFFIFCLLLKTGRHEKAGRLFSFFVSFRLISVFFRKFIQTKSKDYSFTLLAKNVVWAYLWVDAHYPSLSPLSPTWAYQRFLCHLFEVKKGNAFYLGEGGGGWGINQRVLFVQRSTWGKMQ